MGRPAQLIKHLAATALCVGVAALGAACVPTPTPVAAESVTIEGHGYGHGRGMGQWGAYGYARQGWNVDQILMHYYSNTSFGVYGNDALVVRMDEVQGPTVVQSDLAGGGFRVDAEGRTLVSSGLNCVQARATSIGTNRYRVECAPLWQPFNRVIANDVAGPVAFTANRWVDPVKDAVQLQVPAGWRYFRGNIRAGFIDGAPRTVNVVGVESFLRATVAAEMPYTWGLNGGQAAIEAQTVAARTYAWAVRNWNRYRGVGWDTCTSFCQAYGGFRLNDRQLEWPNVDAAVAATAGKIMVNGGRPILAEYSASTGGYTAPGLSSQPWFQPVVDAGDDTPGNPSHMWRVTLSAAQIQSKWPEIGAFSSMQVTARNGLGDWGGRVTSMVIQGTSGQVTITGNTLRNAFNLKSDWFRVV